MNRRHLFLSALLFAATALPAAETKTAPKTVRLLTIGNSFSANATKHLSGLVKAGGHTLIHQPIVVSGASMQLHAERAQLHEKDLQDKAGLYSNGLGLRENLTKDAWDYVTIQQASIKSHDLATYQPYAGWLRDYIAKHAPKAKLLVHQTWAYRVDDPRFTKPSDKPGAPKTQEEMYRGLSNAYTQIATEFKAAMLPVGHAFYAADTDPAWGFKPDTAFEPKKAKHPELPKQPHSLHVGWKWTKQKSGKYTIGMDGHHANMAGEYLGGCVWYEVLFGESAVGNTFVPKGLDAADARYLQETAHKAVVEQQKKEGGS